MNDILNAIFELIGSLLAIMNIVKLIKDKAIRGVYWPIWAFYTAWGFWNLYYYPSVDCWYSFLAGIIMVIANLIWLILAVRYRKN
jgi:hypothetical protein